jgi:hypothetical protein
MKNDQQPLSQSLPFIAPLLLLPILLLWRPLFAGETLFWGTPLLQFIPWQRATVEMWRAGHLPLWNPLLGCGAPLAANYQTGAFYPLYGLALVIPPEVALGWTTALHLALAGFGMVAWARAAGMDRFPALLAGLAVEGSGFLVARAGLFPSIVVTFAWIPIWLWRAERFYQTQKTGDALWLGTTLGLGLLAGHAQTAFYGLLLLVAYLTFRFATAARHTKATSSYHSLLIVSLIIVPLTLLAAVQLLPTAELLTLSQRAGGVDREIGLTYSFWPWRTLTLFAPDFFGNPARSTYWGYATYWEDAAYIGLLPLLLAFGAVIRLRRKGEWRPAVVFWAGVTGLSLFLALGRHNPVFMWLFEHIPSFDAFQSPARWLALTTIGLAALAGIGAQTWRRGRADRRRGALGLALGLALVIGGIAAPHLVPSIPATFGPATARLGGTLAAIGGLILLRKKKGRWWAALVGLIFLDLLVFGWGLIPSVDRALYEDQTATATALADDSTVERIFWPAGGQPEPGYALKFAYFDFAAYGPYDAGSWWPLRESLLPNLGMLDGVPSANNFDPLLVNHFAEISRAADTAPNLLRVMGVTHLVTTTASGETTITPVANALGRAWIVPTARQVASEEMLDALVDPAFDPAAEVLLETPPDLTTPPTSHSPSPITLHDAPNRVTIRTALDQSGYLVLADTWYPGWTATVDGEPVPLLRANHAFRAVLIQAGNHVVEMTYRPVSLAAGAILSLMALAGLTVGWIWTQHREKRE